MTFLDYIILLEFRLLFIPGFINLLSWIINFAIFAHFQAIDELVTSVPPPH